MGLEILQQVGRAKSGEGVQAFAKPATGGAGQASVEMVAVAPLLVLVTVACLHLAIAGWALWAAEEAARVGVRAGSVDLQARPRALAALPRIFRDDATFELRKGRARVEVAVPTLMPGVSLPRVGAEAGPIEPDA